MSEAEGGVVKSSSMAKALAAMSALRLALLDDDETDVWPSSSSAGTGGVTHSIDVSGVESEERSMARSFPLWGLSDGESTPSRSPGTDENLRDPSPLPSTPSLGPEESLPGVSLSGAEQSTGQRWSDLSNCAACGATTAKLNGGRSSKLQLCGKCHGVAYCGRVSDLMPPFMHCADCTSGSSFVLLLWNVCV